MEKAINSLAEEIAKDTPNIDKVLDNGKIFADTLYHHATTEDKVLIPIARDILSPKKMEEFNKKLHMIH